MEHFTLQLNLSGQLIAEVPSGIRNVAPGEIILFNMTRPQRTILKNAHLLTFSVSPEVVEAASPDAANLHGAVLSGPKSGLLADFMVSLVRRRIADEADAISGATLMFHQALAMALNGQGVALSGNSDDALQRVKLLIESRLTARELSPEWLARNAGLSRTRLYDLFKPAGGISRYIQKRRASRLRALLTRPETRNLPVGTLALQAGFASESHAIRTFSEHFNISPGQHRRAVLQLSPARQASAHEEFDDWIKALN
jgi:AraC-like DNA-binding protein